MMKQSGNEPKSDILLRVGLLGTTALALAAVALALGAAASGSSNGQPLPYGDGFENGTAGWSGTGLWHRSTDRADEGQWSWYYGNESGPGLEDNTYETANDPNQGNLTSPTIDLTNATFATLSFSQWWKGEGSPYERPMVYVGSVNGTGNDTLVYDGTGSTSNGWQRVHVNLTEFAGSSIRVRFHWDTVDGIQNNHEGWYVDDVRIADEPTPTPDLIAEALTILPAEPVAGDRVQFQVRVRNAGDAPADGATLRWLLDGATLETTALGLIPPGASTTAYAWWTGSEGNHTLDAFADANDNVTESDETNNRAGQTFTVAPAPDLWVSALTADPTDPIPGSTVVVTATVRNDGAGDAAPSTVRLAVDGTTLADVPVAGLAPGASATVSANWTAATGNHTLRATADAYHAVNETNENNNTRETQLVVNPLPDLVAVDLTLHPEAPVAGDLVHAEVSIANVGDTLGDGNLFRWIRDGVVQDEQWTGALGPGSSVRYDLWWTATPGNHTIEAVADANGTVTEADETNNTATLAYAVAAAPDLVVTDLSTDPAQPTSLAPADVVATIRNDGAGPAGSSTVRLLVDGALLADVPIGALGPGESTTARVAWNGTPGNHTLRAEADVHHARNETNEVNNSLNATAYVAAPDLALTGLTLADDAPQAGDPVTFRAHVTNAGDVASPAFAVRFLVDGGALVNVNVPGLPAGATTTVEATWTGEPGDHQVTARVDDDDTVAESDEGNNHGTHAFHVAAADLTVTSLTIDPSEPRELDEVTVNATVWNHGNVTARNFTVRIEIDGQTLADVLIPELPAGNETRVTATWTALHGDHHATATADAGDAVPEHDESDNNRTTAFHVTPLANLQVPSLTVTPAEPLVATPATFEVVILNAGNATATPTVLRLLLDGQNHTEVPVPSLQPGATHHVNVTWLATSSGNHTIRAVADANDQVDETDETDNEREHAFHVRATPL